MKHKGYLAPILVAVLIILYYTGMLLLFMTVPGIVWWAKLLICLIPLLLCGLIIAVTVQRIREIRSGETDDLDQY